MASSSRYQPAQTKVDLTMRSRLHVAALIAMLSAVPALAADGPGCPSTLAELRQPDVSRIASCASVHEEVCIAVCGPRYDKIEVRNFGQTGSRPGVLCQDTSIDSMKHGKSYAADPMRASCLEVHQGTFSWCTNYNRTVQGVNFGAFVQCQGRQISKGG